MPSPQHPLHLPDRVSWAAARGALALGLLLLTPLPPTLTAQQADSAATREILLAVAAYHRNRIGELRLGFRDASRSQFAPAPFPRHPPGLARELAEVLRARHIGDGSPDLCHEDLDTDCVDEIVSLGTPIITADSAQVVVSTDHCHSAELCGFSNVHHRLAIRGGRWVMVGLGEVHQGTLLRLRRDTTRIAAVGSGQGAPVLSRARDWLRGAGC